MANTVNTDNSYNGVTTYTAGTDKKTGLENVDFTTYITLLTKQLQNQDPLKPMDSSQFTSEIATYSQLEQQIKGNDLLEKLADNKDYTMQGVAASYLGKEVLAEDRVLNFDGTHVVDFGYDITGENAVSADLQIVNSATGEVVKTTKIDESTGLHTVTWDGTDEDGNTLEAGTYYVRVSAVDADGKVVAAHPLTYTTATELLVQDGELYIKTANGNVVPFADVKSVRQAASA